MLALPRCGSPLLSTGDNSKSIATRYESLPGNPHLLARQAILRVMRCWPVGALTQRMGKFAQNLTTSSTILPGNRLSASAPLLLCTHM